MLFFSIAGLATSVAKTSSAEGQDDINLEIPRNLVSDCVTTCREFVRNIWYVVHMHLLLLHLLSAHSHHQELELLSENLSGEIPSYTSEICDKISLSSWNTETQRRSYMLVMGNKESLGLGYSENIKLNQSHRRYRKET